MDNEKATDNDIVEVSVSVQNFAKDLELDIVLEGRGNITLNTVNVSRPGLQLAGFFDYFGANRVQVLGNAEMQFLSKMTYEERQYSLTQFFKYPIPCIIIGRDLTPLPEMIEIAKQNGVPVFLAHTTTTAIVNHIVMYLNRLLAPSVTKHAGLIDVYGVGLLLTGKSGIGKSETALELIKRGHRLIADDLVIISRIENALIGTAPEAIRYFMEIRGIGIIDVKSMYGVGAVMHEKRIELVVELENWDEKKKYDRLDSSGGEEYLLGIKLPKLVIPVKPGRNLAIIIEVAARHYRQKEMGYDAAAELINRSSISKAMKK
jgi:HPr kinase/phosphorylase